MKLGIIGKLAEGEYSPYGIFFGKSQWSYFIIGVKVPIPVVRDGKYYAPLTGLKKFGKRLLVLIIYLEVTKGKFWCKNYRRVILRFGAYWHPLVDRIIGRSKLWKAIHL